MPAPKMRRPACLGCVAGPPRSTPTSIASSSRTRSTAISMARVESSSSALRQPWFWLVTIPTGPSRSTRIGPRSTLPSRRNASKGGQRLGAGLRHRADQVGPAPRVGEHAGDEVSLRDLQPRLLGLVVGALGLDLGARGKQVGMALGGRVDQLGQPQRPRQAVGELVVDGQDVMAAGRSGDTHAPPTTDSCPVQYGARSSRLRTLPAPDLGSGSVVSSMRLGIL